MKTCRSAVPYLIHLGESSLDLDTLNIAGWRKLASTYDSRLGQTRYPFNRFRDTMEPDQ